jgi:hypothetical protein
MFSFLNLAVVVSSTLQIYNLTQIGRGRIPYYTMIIVYIMYIFIEAYLASQRPEQAAMFLYVVLNAYALLQCSLGLYRKKKKENG